MSVNGVLNLSKRISTLRSCLKTEGLTPIWTDGTDQEQAKARTSAKAGPPPAAKEDKFDCRAKEDKFDYRAKEDKFDYRAKEDKFDYRLLD